MSEGQGAGRVFASFSEKEDFMREGVVRFINKLHLSLYIHKWVGGNMSDTKLISGTAAAVIIGFVAIIYSIFGKDPFGTKVVIFLLGCLFAWLGLRFSRG